jgi:protein-tyrosine-phosphatase
MKRYKDYMNPRLAEYVKLLAEGYHTISSDRKEILDQMSMDISRLLKEKGSTKIIFICTHNSRRSHLAQLWAEVAIYHFDICYIECYSGGTEASAFHPNTVAAVQRCGIEAESRLEGSNPHYRVSFALDGPVLDMFSKEFGDVSNPSSGFVAVMTCTDADEACPFVPGADLRYSLPYEDPKKSDGTDSEDQTYDERCREIGTEMLYLFQKVRKGI